jgi:outer membrane protein insertion porin family
MWIVGCLLIACSFLTTARADNLGDFLGRKVTGVEVILEGVTASGTGALKQLIEIAPGQEFSTVRVHDALVRLHKSGLITGARVEAAEEGASGVALRFIVRPQARIEKVSFEGNAVFSSAELRSRLHELNLGEKLSQSVINQGAGELLSYYAAHGYYQADVASEVRLDQSGTRAVVVYRIKPGDQAKVARYTTDIKGTPVELGEIKRQIVEQGPFSDAALQADIEQIRQAYLKESYLAVRVTNNVAVDMVKNSVAITISVESGPFVSVDVVGYRLEDKEKHKVFAFYRTGGIDDLALEDGRRRLQDYIQRRGYFFAEIPNPDPPDLEGDKASITYHVETGARYRLTDIDFEGLEALDAKTIEEQLKTQRAAFIPLAGPGRGFTSNELLRQDSLFIQKQLYELGYRRADVEVRRGVSIEGEKLIITFRVRQGPRTYIESVDVRGNTIFTEQELRQRLTVKPGDPFVTSAATQNADGLLALYNLEGYSGAQVFSEIVDLGSAQGQERVRLVLAIAEGNAARIRTVTTRGLSHTKASRLENDFYLFKKGERLRNDRLLETERALYETDAFQTVAITSESVGQGADGTEEHDVRIDLIESKRFLLIYGFGYQSSQSDLEVPGLGFLGGVRGNVQLTDVNLLGKLYTGSAQLRLSRTELLGQLTFQNPRPLGFNYPSQVSVFARRLAEKSFRQDRYTALFQIERRFSQEAIGYISYNFERINIFDLRTSIDEIARNSRPIRLGRIAVSYARDTRDNAFESTRGSFTLGGLSVASSALGGNEQFVRFNAEHTRYYPIKKLNDSVYLFSTRLGLAAPFKGKNSLPISERFFAGGARDLRGFGFEEAGPRDPVTGEPVGGNALLVVNNEMRFPITGILGGAVFSDTGNVFARVKDFQLQDLTQTIGAGLLAKTPIGPVRIDFAFPILNRPDSEKRYRIHFTFGQTF